MRDFRLKARLEEHGASPLAESGKIGVETRKRGASPLADAVSNGRDRMMKIASVTEISCNCRSTHTPYAHNHSSLAVTRTKHKQFEKNIFDKQKNTTHITHTQFLYTRHTVHTQFLYTKHTRTSRTTHLHTHTPNK